MLLLTFILLLSSELAFARSSLPPDFPKGESEKNGSVPTERMANDGVPKLQYHQNPDEHLKPLGPVCVDWGGATPAAGICKRHETRRIDLTADDCPDGAKRAIRCTAPALATGAPAPEESFQCTSSCMVFLVRQPHKEKLVACTMEAKICADGSSVGRVGPHCEFEACPGGK